MFGFKSKKEKELEVLQENLTKVIDEEYKKRTQLEKLIERNKEKEKENNSKERELTSSITADKIKTVLKILIYNNLEPDRIIVNDAELKSIKNFRDTIKLKDGLKIYDVRIVNQHTKRPFVVSVKK